KAVEEGRGEGAYHAGGGASGGGENAFGLPALPGPGRYSTGAAAADPAGAGGGAGRRDFSGRGLREVSGLRAEPSARIRTVLSARIRTVPVRPFQPRRGQAGGPAGAGRHETKAGGKAGRIAQRSRAAA